MEFVVVIIMFTNGMSRTLSPDLTYHACWAGTNVVIFAVVGLEVVCLKLKKKLSVSKNPHNALYLGLKIRFVIFQPF